MSESPQVKAFTGKSWSECSEFIVAVRKRAALEGKQRDFAWMADFASPYFALEALAWHIQLPQDVREDWTKLEVALMGKWYRPNGDREEQADIEPTPAAYPPQAGSRGARSVNGILKLTSSSRTSPVYIKWDGNEKNFCTFTSNIAEALHLQRSSKANNVLFKLVDSSEDMWLAIGWRSKDAKFETGTTQFGRLVVFSLETGKPPLAGDNTWSVLACTPWAKGELLPIWSHGNGTYRTLGGFITSEYVYLAADPDAYSTQYPNENRVHLFFEEID